MKFEVKVNVSSKIELFFFVLLIALCFITEIIEFIFEKKMARRKRSIVLNCV